MNSLRVQNLKSIKDSTYIEIKPLTVLIGKNSCGKSSFIRTFPLLKQSLTKKISAPILWYGEYVDFGSFRNSLSSGCSLSKDCITFSTNFTYELTENFLRTSSTKQNIQFSYSVRDGDNCEYLISFENKHFITAKPNSKSKYDVCFDDSLIDGNCIYSDTHFSLGDERDLDNFFIYGHTFFVPGVLLNKYNINDINFRIFPYRTYEGISYDLIFDSKKRSRVAKQLLTSMVKKGIRIDEEDVELESSHIQKYLVVNLLNDLISYFKNEFSRVQYYQPIRARGDRFYRVQGLRINEVDSDGNNAPMILYSMAAKERRAFEQWCRENLGFVYSIHPFDDGSESASIVVRKDENGDEHNLTDTGFGYSQVLPIVLSAWLNYSSKKTDKPIYIVIEQPELHLHPAFQKKILKLFLTIINTFKKDGGDLRFIIETHSETIVNYLGKQINLNIVDKDDVNLVVCDKKDGITSFDKMVFNDNGVIENWPIGFFSDEDDN